MIDGQFPMVVGARGAPLFPGDAWSASAIGNWSLAIAGVAAAAAAAVAAPARAFTFDSCGPDCHPRWARGEIRLYANAEAGDCDLAAMGRAIARWNVALDRVGVGVRIVLAGRTTTYGLRRDGVSSVSLLVKRWPREPRLFGWTSTWWRGDRIVEADIAFNLRHHRFRCDIPERRGPVASLEQEMMHELGHVLGLGHARTGIMKPEGYGTAVDPDAMEGLRVLYGR